MMKEISVIVPVYNCADYLKECIDSVINQTIGFKKIELIIINDGSTDNSLEIITKYQKQYPEIIIINQSNQGLSASRNIGIRKSTSSFITFLDSDDYLVSNALEIMYKKIMDTKCDLVIGRINAFDSKKAYGYYSDRYIIDKDNYQLKDNYKLLNAISVCGKLYKRETIKNLEFINNVKHEDNYFTIKTYFNSKNISSITNYVYMRRYRDGEQKSIMQSLNYNTFCDLLLNFEKLLNEIPNNIFLNMFIIKKSNIYICKHCQKEKLNGRKQIKKLINKHINKYRFYYLLYDRIIYGVLKVIFLVKR